MPKKYQPHYAKSTNSSYVHPSLQTSRASSSDNPPAPRTVNERIQQLRREQTPKATTERRDEVIDVVTQRTVPPALRRILNIPEPNAPLPKPGTRDRTVRARRPPPGPAAPSSWLQNSRHAPDHIRKLRRRWEENGYGERSAKFCPLATIHSGEYKRLPLERSLSHAVLKTFALNWEELVEFEQYYLAAIPTPLKEALLSYVTLYGPRDCMDIRLFKILFLTNTEVEEGTGSEEVKFLDLTGLLNETFTLVDLYKYIGRPKSGLIEAMNNVSISPEPSNSKLQNDVAESWEEEADSTAIEIPKPLISSRFPQLTRLSLGHPGASASWPHLLTLSTKLNTLTHLSLAYWPVPSSTPNATTAAMVSKHTKPVNLGGTHIYSEMDDDWHEAANILRRLSQNTYSLKWLDLEGCTWHKALTWDEPLSTRPSRRETSWAKDHTAPGPNWAGSWRQIEYLNLSQGWVPQDMVSITRMPSSIIAVQLLGWLRHLNESEEGFTDAEVKLKAWDLDEWMEKEKVAREVAFGIQQRRKVGGGVYCRVDYGWDPFAGVGSVKRKDEDTS